MITFGDIADTVEATIGYVSRLKGEGLEARVKDAFLWGLPGYFAREDDADENTTGTEDAVVLENGDERLIIATRNATAWSKLLDYLGRALDKGERVVSASDGTGRSYVTVRPAGKVVIKSDSGSGETVEITCDEATGDLTILTSRNIVLNPAGGATVHVGGDAYSLARYEELRDYVNTAVTGLKAIFDGHPHEYLNMGAPAATSVPLTFLAGAMTLGPPKVAPSLPVTVASTSGRCD